MAFLPLTAQTPAFQLVATLGPASLDLAGALANAGATAFRLNASHLTSAELRHATTKVRKAIPDAPIVVDLQGAKMRLGQFAETAIRAGEGVRFALASGASSSGYPLPHPEVFRAAARDDTLTCDDGRLRFRVLNATDDSLEAMALEDGVLRPRKGVNLLEHPVDLEDLTEGDCAHCAEVGELANAAWAYSFMKDGDEANWLRRRLPGARVIGKIERREATANLARIAARVDALWICRGDLGEQLGPAQLARFVASIDVRAVGRPVLMAGQVLEHLTHHTRPTRSEICHLYDLFARGYAGIVLSDETAIGADPVRAVETAATMLRDFAAVR